MLQAVRRAARDTLSGTCLAGEADFAYQGIADDLLAHHASRTAHHVEHTRRQATRMQQLGQAQGRQRRRAGRLDHECVADCHRRGDLVGHQGQREIPGDDRADYPDRSAHHQTGGFVRGQWDVLPARVRRLTRPA